MLQSAVRSAMLVLQTGQRPRGHKLLRTDNLQVPEFRVVSFCSDWHNKQHRLGGLKPRYSFSMVPEAGSLMCAMRKMVSWGHSPCLTVSCSPLSAYTPTPPPLLTVRLYWSSTLRAFSMCHFCRGTMSK